MSQPLELMTVLKELYNISGFRVSVHDTEMNEVAAYPNVNSGFCHYIQSNPKNLAICLQTDLDALKRVRSEKEMIIYRCKFGLYEAVVPLYDCGDLAGFLMMGQFRDADGQDVQHIFECSQKYIMDPEKLLAEIQKIPVCTKDKIVSYLNIMRICAEYITLTNRLNLTDRNLVREIRNYLQQNYYQKISIDQLAKHFLCSKSTLMNSFKKTYHTTINQYLTDVRLEQAKILLERRGISIHEIAERCGFSDQNYFSKVFYKAFQMTPSKYREEIQMKSTEE